MKWLRLLRNLLVMVLYGKSSRRAVAAAFKICGLRLARRWPFVAKAEAGQLNLGFDDLLLFQHARNRNFTALVIGAFDGVENDPAAAFIRTNHCKAVFVEPQPAPFARLLQSLGKQENTNAVQAAIDEVSGSRQMYAVNAGVAGLPAWTEQLASFSLEHLLKHEDRAPGLSQHIVTLEVPTLSFAEVLNRYSLQSIDLLQIDTEGMDAQLLAWFPFDRVLPALLHYEIAHMLPAALLATHKRLAALGYTLLPGDSAMDEMAVWF